MGKQQGTPDLGTVSTEELLRQLQSREIKGGKLTFEVDYDGLGVEMTKIKSQFANALNPLELF
jgi:hypothetical protein